MSNTQQNQTVEPKKSKKPGKPNETGTVNVQGHFRVFDPTTQKPTWRDEHDNSRTGKITGHVKIHDPASGKIFYNDHNAIHYENISIAMAQSLADRNLGYIYQMAFGNGGSSVDPTGVITYLPPNTTGQSAALYNQTYQKVVDDNSAADTDPRNNRMTVLHTAGNLYTDILVTCLLDYGEPAEQQAFDNSTNYNGEYVFDELGLKTWNGAADNLRLITHVIFHPVQKSLNRQIQIDYTLRIQTLSNVNAV